MAKTLEEYVSDIRVSIEKYELLEKFIKKNGIKKEDLTYRYDDFFMFTEVNIIDEIDNTIEVIMEETLNKLYFPEKFDKSRFALSVERLNRYVNILENTLLK